MITLCKNETVPHILRASKFRSTRETPNSEDTKNQYFYRIMVFTAGSATVDSEFFTGICKMNDILYLLPDTPYRILNTHGDFEVLNIYFDYFENTCAENEYIHKTLFQTEFDKKHCRETYNFIDAPGLNTPCIIRNSFNISDYAGKIFSEYTRACGASMRLVSLLISCIIEEICRKELFCEGVSGKYEEMISYIKDNCSEKLTAEGLSEKFHYHKNHINRIIKSNTGMNLKTFILKSKMDMADRLLEETNMNITEIANYLNFFDASHYIKTRNKTKNNENG